MNMQTVVSKDGTEIAYDRSGSGPVIIMMAAGPTDHWALAGIAELLSEDFTVFNYDLARPGRQRRLRPLRTRARVRRPAGTHRGGGR